MKKNNVMKQLPAFLLVLITTISNAQESKILSYEDFIDNVLQHHPMVKRAENETQYGEMQYKAARGNYDPMIGGNYDQKHYNGSSYFTNGSIELKQPVFTSQYLRFGHDYGVGPYLNPELNTPAGGLSYMGIEVGILQGLLLDKRRTEVLKSKEYVRYYNAEKQIQINGLLFEASQRYFEWLFGLELIALNNYFMNAADQRLAGIKALAEIGERATLDTIEAVIFYQTRLLEMQNVFIENQKSINSLSQFNWQSGSPSELTTTYKPLDSLDVCFVKFKEVLANDLASSAAANPVLFKYHSFQKVLDIESRWRKELIKPVLNVKYNFLFNTSSSYPGFSSNDYKIGVHLSFPLLLRNPINEYRMARVASQNNTLELQSKKNELDFKTSVLKQTLTLLTEQLKNAERSAEYSKQLVDGEKLKFENGESSVFMLNTRETKWLESQVKVAEYKLKFIQTVLNLMYLNGDLNYSM